MGAIQVSLIQTEAGERLSHAEGKGTKSFEVVLTQDTY